MTDGLGMQGQTCFFEQIGQLLFRECYVCFRYNWYDLSHTAGIEPCPRMFVQLFWRAELLKTLPQFNYIFICGSIEWHCLGLNFVIHLMVRHSLNDGWRG